MQIFGKGQNPVADSASAPVSEKKNNRFSNNKRSIIAVVLVVLTALCLRMIFSVGLSAGNDFALSGGTVATQHLNNIVAIMNGNLAAIGSAMGYPDGAANVIPILIDLVLAVFAMLIQTITGMDAIQSASLALGASAPIMGALACIPMYFLGKEIFGGKKRAGFLAALFLAFCPVAVTNTVFSNGTEIAFVLFFFTCALYFVVKGIKALNCDRSAKDGFGQAMSQNKSAMIYAVLAGIFLALIAYTWNGFRSTIVLFLVTMGIMVIYNRLRDSDPRPVAAFFSIIVAVPVVLAAPYYIATGLWNLVFSGIAIATALGVICCVSFAMLKEKAWTVTIPAYVGVLIVLFVVLYFVAPSLFSDIVHGNSVYSEELSGIIGSTTITFSEFVTFYGFMTVWCAPILVIYMISKFKGNAGNVAFVSMLIGLFLGIILSVSSTMAAVVFSPIFALGFAWLLTWVFDTISYSDYFKSFRGCDAKTLIKRIFSPKPFISILCVVLLVGAPNAIGAMDASISYNEKSDWNDDSGFDLLGALGYTIYTKDDYRINQTLKSYADENKNTENIIVTWMDYSTDVSLYGNFTSMTDNQGNNTVPMANILLADETRGEATAAIIVFLMKNYGTDASVKIIKEVVDGPSNIVEKVTPAVEKQLKTALNNPHSLRNKVLGNPDYYGDLSNSVSDENVSYIYLKKFMTQGAKLADDEPFEGFTIVELSNIYKKLSDDSGLKITHIMGTLSMIPVQYGDGSVFSTIAAINGYNLDSQYGYVPEFYSFYNNSYYANATMKNTLLYKLVMGKTTEEATESGDSSRFEAVYQLCNFEADYDHFKVRYNPDDNAAADADGWQDLNYYDAYAKKTETGKGTINPYAFPMVAKFVPAFETKVISGYVTDFSDSPVANARVEFWANNGMKAAMTYTDENGYYELPITTNKETAEGMIVGENAVLKIFTGTAKTDTTGGALLKTVPVMSNVDMPGTNVKIEKTSISGSIDFKDEEDPTKILDIEDIEGAKVTMTAKNHEDIEYIFDCDFDSNAGDVLNFESPDDVDIVIDTYDIKVTSANGTSLGSGTYSVKPGQNDAYVFIGTISELTLTVTDQNGENLKGIQVSLSGDGVFTAGAKGETDIFGKTTIMVSPGKYYVSVKDNSGENKNYVVVSGADFTVSGSSSSQTIKLMEAVEISFAAGTCTLDTLIVTNGTTNFVANLDNGNYVVYLPLPDINASTEYMAYGYDSGHKLYYTYFSVNKNSGTVSPVVPAITAKETVKVTGELKNKDDKFTSGKVTFFTLNDKKVDFFLTVSAMNLENDDEEKYIYTAYLPKDGSYYVYANDGSSQATIMNELVVGTDEVTNNIKLEEGYKLSLTLRWGSSNAFKYTGIDVKVYAKDKTSEEDTEFELTLATDSSGKCNLVLPKNRSGIATADVYDGATPAEPKQDGTYYWVDTDEEKKQIKKYTQTKDFNSDSRSSYMTASVLALDILKDPEPVNEGEEDVPDKWNYTITNKTGYDLTVDGNEIKAGEVYYSTSSLKYPYVTIKLEYQFIGDTPGNGNGYYYYLNIDVPIKYRDLSGMDKPNIDLDDSFESIIMNNAKKYVKVAIVYDKEKPTVSLKNIREDDVVDENKPFKDLEVEDEGTVSIAKDDYLYEEKGYTKAIIKYISYNTLNSPTTKGEDYGLTNPYLLKVSYTKGDVKEVYYRTLLGNESGEYAPIPPDDSEDADYLTTSVIVYFSASKEDDAPDSDLRPASYFTGVTGLTEDGTLVVEQTINDENEPSTIFTQEIKDGTFEILLPFEFGENSRNDVTYSYELKAFQEKEINDLEKIKYRGSVTLDVDDVVDENYIVNIPVTGSEIVPNDGEKVTLTIAEMAKDGDNYKIVFNVDLASFDSGTYMLEAGSAWMHLTFYEVQPTNAADEKVIENVTLPLATGVKIKAVGYAKMGTTDSTASYDSRNLSVIVKKLNGDEVARGTFGTSSGGLPTGWSKNESVPIELDFGTNKYGSGERSFAVKLTNKNNYPVAVTFTIPPENDGVHLMWYYTYDDKVVEYEGESTIHIAGASSLQLNITGMTDYGAITEEIFANELKFSLVTSGSDSFVLSKDYKKTDDNHIDLSDSDKKAGFFMKVSPGSAEIESSETEGGGVFDSLGEAPRALSILAAIIILELVIFFWVGIKRGVFGRKK